MAGSFALLVAVSSVHLRIAAWFPENAPLETIHALAFGALTLGALGSLGATRVTTFLTALALTRAGLVLFAFLGGVQGQVPLLLELAASGVSLLLLAAAAEKLDTLDDVSKLTSIARRVVLTLGALSASSFPPFPGFIAAFPLSSAVLDRGHPFSLILACALLLLSCAGAMRLVARAWGSDGSRTVDTTVGPAPVALALAAVWFLGIAPESVIEVAIAAARSIF
jgi:formate hydrogenlyase subunit 3/multisubunit Na+/H+ antiporter MnhD subunit